MNSAHTKSSEMPELLRRLSRQTLDAWFLGTVGSSEIYQVQEGWQKEALLQDKDVCVARNGTDFENAVASANVSSIYVPNNALLTQEIVERMLLRNPLAKTVYWEAFPVQS